MHFILDKEMIELSHKIYTYTHFEILKFEINVLENKDKIRKKHK